MNRMLSFRQAIALIYLSSVIPLLILVGVLVYIEYRTFLNCRTPHIAHQFAQRSSNTVSRFAPCHCQHHHGPTRQY